MFRGALGRLNIPQLTGIDVIDVVVFAGIRVVKDLTGVDTQLAHQPLPAEEVKGVIDGRLGGLACPPVIQLLQHLIGTEVAWPLKQQLCDINALAGGVDLLALQQLDDFVLIQGTTYIRIPLLDWEV